VRVTTEVRLRLPDGGRGERHAVARQRHPRDRAVADRTLQAQVFRQGYGGNRVDYLDFYVGDTITRNRMTLDLGLRYDQQWGMALPSQTLANAAFPNVVPGLAFGATTRRSRGRTCRRARG